MAPKICVQLNPTAMHAATCLNNGTNDASGGRLICLAMHVTMSACVQLVYTNYKPFGDVVPGWLINRATNAAGATNYI